MSFSSLYYGDTVGTIDSNYNHKTYNLKTYTVDRYAN